ncbi:helix-turn-helix domain-containing protein [Aeromonas rivipollensis]|uniref:helix-turn-helix domain-containing protein n=1 Tax=Aeromonas rivipollensis TaxID=948519 RepID=UPI0038D1FC7B
MEEVRALAAGANVAHGKGNTEADYHNIIKRLMALGDVYMDDAFEPNVNKIADAIGAARPKVRKGYSSYAPDGGLTLSKQLQEKKKLAILEQHKEGMSARAIARLFGMGNDAVSDIIKKLSGIADSAKTDTQPSPLSPPPRQHRRPPRHPCRR